MPRYKNLKVHSVLGVLRTLHEGVGVLPLQVMGKNKLTFTEMINLDLQYSRTMSAQLDTLIILYTVPAIVGQFIESRLALTVRAAEEAKVEMAPQRATLTTVN